MAAPPPDVVAAVSLLLPGAGHFWIGQRRKAAFVFAGALFTGCLCGAWNVLAALDAGWLTRKLLRGESVGPYENAPVADFLSRL